MDRNEELRIYMKAARAEFYDGDERHLGKDEMIAFCQERMAAAGREAARRHIIQCDHCLQLFKDVNDFFGPPREDEVEVGELQVRRAWKEFWLQAKDMQETTAGAIELSRGGFSRVIWPMAAAASLLLGLATVFAWREKEGKETAQRQIAQMQNEQSKLEARLGQIERNAHDQLRLEREQKAQAEARAEALQNRLHDLQQERQNILIYGRVLSSEKGGGDDWQLSIPGAAKTFWLSLTRSKPYEFPEYSIELLDQQGRSVAGRQGLRPIGSGYLIFALSRSEAPAGKYSLLLYGHRGKSKRELGKYELSISFSR
jgi:hypothetical protein